MSHNLVNNKKMRIEYLNKKMRIEYLRVIQNGIADMILNKTQILLQIYIKEPLKKNVILMILTNIKHYAKK